MPVCRTAVDKRDPPSKHTKGIEGWTSKTLGMVSENINTK